MKLTINGEAKDLEASFVLDVLELLALDPTQTIVELNQSIIDQTRYAKTKVTAEDQLELIRFMGGG